MMQAMDALRDLLDDPSFQAAVAYSGIAFVVVTLVASTRLWGRRPPLAGMAFAGATLAALGGLGPARSVGDLPDELFVGLAVLAVTGIVLDWRTLPLGVVAVALLPGAWIVGLGVAEDRPGWVVPLVVVVVALGGALAADHDRYQQRRGFGPALLAIAVVGLYATVPDTEHARVAIGAAMPLLFFGIPTPVARLGTSGAATGTALVMWIASVDGAARPTAIIGTAGAFGLLFAEPIGRRLFQDLRRKVRRKGVHLGRGLVVVTDVLLFDAVLAAYASRISGFSRTTLGATLLLVPMAALAIVVAGAIPAPPRSRTRRGRRGQGIVLDR